MLLPDPTALASLLVVALWGALLLWLLSSTAVNFFVPSVLYWARRLRLRPDLVGATLITLGNGAPELFTAGTAASKDDLPLAFSEMLGGDLLMLSVAGGTVLFIGRRYARSRGQALVPVSHSVLKAASAAYATAVLVLVVFTTKGYIRTWEALCFPLVYVLFVSMLIRSGNSDSVPDQVPETCETPAAWIAFASESTHSRLCTLLWYVMAPFYGLRFLTIPPADGSWSSGIRILCSLSPLGFAGFLIGTGWLGTSESSIGLHAGVLLAAGALGVYVLKRSDAAQGLPWFYPGIALMGSCSTVLWLDVVATELTELVEFLGHWLDIPSVILGSTLVSWGNSIGDLLGLCALADCGHMQSAVVAVVSTPVFDLMTCGFALAVAASSHAGEVRLFTGEQWPPEIATVLALAAFCIGACLLMLMVVALHTTMSTTPLSLYAAYAGFLIVMAVTA